MNMPDELPEGWQQTARPKNIRACPSCSVSVSLSATACPHCGHTFRQPGAINLSDPVHVIGLIVCGIIILIVVGIFFVRVIG
jgi:uncharacterized paraquat-inducible protein A